LGTTKNQQIRNARIGLVVEFGVGWRGETQCIFCVFSIAGRENTLTVSWPVGIGGLEPDILEDCMLEVDQMITQAAEVMVGVQEVLPLD
jgi:hypothetical protein